jgi:hypothetical protein
LLLLYHAGVGYNAFYEAAVAICNVILDETVCRGALDNYFVIHSKHPFNLRLEPIL